VRVLALHRDVILASSNIWQTNCVLVRGGDECFVVDSPVLPGELEALPSLLEQSGFALSGLLVTHGDWDHLLGRLAFPAAALGCAESTAARLRADVGGPQREMRAFDGNHYIKRTRSLALGSPQALPVSGRCELGDRELGLLAAEGHTADGMAIHAAWAGVLICGDYLSEVEIPSFARAGGSLAAYSATLERFRPVLGDVEHVVPGHGPALDSKRALELLEQDLAYLHGLRREGAGAQLPTGRRSPSQRRIHEENVARLASAG
jgi:glyoxylase-like metal-dependent hydrolase (beta-lactamase superfamily II)